MSKKSRERQRELAAAGPPVDMHPLAEEILAPQEYRQTLQISSAMRQEIVHWTSPYPPPRILEEYEKLVPGSAQKLVEQAEIQTKHRVEIEKIAIVGDGHRSWAGLVLGFVLCVLIIAGGVTCILLGHDWAGATIITGDVIGLASVTITTAMARRNERADRAKMMVAHQETPPSQPGAPPGTAIAK
jgi:uncharacterized membrane protein